MSLPDWPERVVVRVLADNPKRLLLAVLLAPTGAWGAGVAAMYGLTVLDLGEPLRRPMSDALVAPLLTVMFLPIAALPIMVIGSVLHLLLSMSGVRGWAPYVMAGSATGLALGFVFECPYGPQVVTCARRLSPDLILDLFVFAAMPGLGAALAFWIVLRPDLAKAP